MQRFIQQLLIVDFILGLITNNIVCSYGRTSIKPSLFPCKITIDLHLLLKVAIAIGHIVDSSQNANITLDYLQREVGLLSRLRTDLGVSIAQR